MTLNTINRRERASNKAANVSALLGSILIVKDNSVLENLLTQEWRAVFNLYNINRTRQDLEQMTNASEQLISRKSLDRKIEI